MEGENNAPPPPIPRLVNAVGIWAVAVSNVNRKTDKERVDFFIWSGFVQLKIFKMTTIAANF